MTDQQNKADAGAPDGAPDDRSEHDKTFDYVTHNYDAMNRAIDTEVDRRFEISELYRYEGSSRRTLMFMHIVVSLSVLAATAALIWWLFHQPVMAPVYDASFDRSTADALAVISRQENPGAAAQPFIDTSFTVFHRSVMSTGEFVVTGKTYQPDNLSFPSEQYCYLERAQSSSGLSGEPLAVISEGEFTLETEKPDLILFAKKYCKFSR